MSVLVALFALLVYGPITAYLAHNRGRRWWLWYIFGSACILVALPVLLIKGHSTETQRKCPYCQEWITSDATVCRFCRREVQ